MIDTEFENEPYNRWQGIRIAQLGTCISLFLTFAVATLGFSITLLVDKDYKIVECFPKFCFLSAIVSGCLSILFGSLACLTRLRDFRITAKIVRFRDAEGYRDKIEEYRKESNCFGKRTWRRFWWQLVAFFFQVSGLVLALGITYWDRLRP